MKLRHILSEITSSSLFGAKISLHGNRLVINNEEYFCDRTAYAIKKGMRPNKTQSGAFYPASKFEGQLQGVKYTRLYEILKDELLARSSEDAIVEKFLSNVRSVDIVSKFMKYMNLELPNFDEWDGIY